MTYDVLYVDPPWAYGNTQLIDGDIKNAKDAYPTMNLKELKAFELPPLSDDCVMFMWTTGPWMGGAIELGSAWGFKYSTVAFVWDKVHTNPGFYTNSQVEYCLLFKKGKIPSPRGTRNEKQLLVEKRTVHSKKPAEIRTRIERMFPTQTRIEMFARNTSPGWDVMGNETTKYDS